MGRALFISDHPRRLRDPAAADERLRAAGFLLEPCEGMMLIDWPPGRYQAYYRSLPLPDLPPFSPAAPAGWGLSRLLREHPAPYEGQDRAVLHQALRLRLLGEEDRLHGLLYRALADALRERRAPPYDAIRLLTGR